MIDIKSILIPLLGSGPIKTWNQKQYQQRLIELTKASIRAYILAGKSEKQAKEASITIGRIYQIGWFRKQPNDEVFSRIEEHVKLSEISFRSKPLAQAIARSLTHR
jgi:hypothetical protein